VIGESYKAPTRVLMKRIKYIGILLSVTIAVLGGRLCAQETASPDPALLSSLMASLPPETPQEKWQDLIFDRNNNYRVRPLTKSEFDSILQKAKTKSEDKTLNLDDRRQWNGAYLRAKWDIEFQDINSLSIAQELLSQAEENQKSAAALEAKNVNDIIATDENFDWGMRVDYARHRIDYLSHLPPQEIWLNKFDRAQSQEDKTKLLQEAWNNSMDDTLPIAVRNYWQAVWTEKYLQEQKAASMPNPYSPDVTGGGTNNGMTCIRTGNVTECNPN
jgi:hypothetical protein